ncbi:MAG: hypothetical protein M3457_23030 [Chloroflexota bacterium]|nr:hypothetical protein [Chloroflexota bacterium]
MNNGFISPDRHGLFNYGFSIVGLGLPALLGLSGAARGLPASLGLEVGMLTAFTRHRYAMKRTIPLSTHGRIETVLVPAYFLAIVASGALDQRGARVFFASYLAAAVTTFFLTDYNAKPER